jgi:hypothetical protein
MLTPSPARLIAAAGLAACSLLIFSTSSLAAVTIGNDLSLAPSDNACNSTVLCTGFGTEIVPSLAQTSPINGVVVKWRLKAGSVNNGDVALRVLHADALLSTFAHGTSATQVSTPGTNVFLTQLPISVGDSVGIDNATAGIYYGAGSGQNIHMYDTPLIDGAPARSPDRNGTDVLLLNADIEADVDQDGFGDESQDGCPSDATRHGPCAVPDVIKPVLTSSSKSTKLSSGGAISFSVTSSENAIGNAGGSIKLPGSSKLVKFKSAAVVFSAQVTTKIKLKLSNKNTRRVRRALKEHKLKAKLSIVASDMAGNSSTFPKTLRLRL